MNNFVTGVGWFIIAMLALALAGFAICCVLWLYEKAMERFAWAVDAKTRLELGRSIGASSWWFSEHPQTSLAIRIMAERIMRGETPDPSQWRDQWRKGICTRSHPHENMNAECERLTNLARASVSASPVKTENNNG